MTLAIKHWLLGISNSHYQLALIRLPISIYYCWPRNSAGWNLHFAPALLSVIGRHRREVAAGRQPAEIQHQQEVCSSPYKLYIAILCYFLTNKDRRIINSHLMNVVFSWSHRISEVKVAVKPPRRSRGGAFSRFLASPQRSRHRISALTLSWTAQFGLGDTGLIHVESGENLEKRLRKTALVWRWPRRLETMV